MIAELLFEPGVMTAEMDPRFAFSGLYPEERRLIANAIDSRQREFTAGRRCARKAIEALSVPSGPIGQQQDRSPKWPHGVVGSITHTDMWCAVGIARRSDGFSAVGIDLEPAKPLPAHLFPGLYRREEREWLAGLASADRGISARAIFSAKEAAYKLQFQLSRQMLEFEDLLIRIDWTASRFTATFEVDAAPFSYGDELHGRIAIRHAHIGCGMALRETIAKAASNPGVVRTALRAAELENGARP